ncbi:MAG TPA: SRPBCC family protein [Usitatibacter sp.]|jgi:uncharacterized protein YndB with AHSA1/START domain|nr:SRPBCC family protein [Usitatibacter sp.]
MNDQKQMSRPVTLIEPGTVKVERLLPGPIERVWAYVTESDKRAKWLAAGEFDLRIGGHIELRFDNDNLSSDKKTPERYENGHKPNARRAMEGVITRLDPPRLLAHTWMWDSGDTEVSYELEPRGSQVLLKIVHRKLAEQIVPAIMGGWDVHTGILDDVLKGKEPRPFWSTHEKMMREYAATL